MEDQWSFEKERRKNLCHNCERIQNEHKELSAEFYRHSDKQIKKDADCDLKISYLEETSKDNKMNIKKIIEEYLPSIRTKVSWILGLLTLVSLVLMFSLNSYMSLATETKKHEKLEQRFEDHLQSAPEQLAHQRKTELNVVEIKSNVSHMKSDISEIKQAIKEISEKLK